MTATRSTWAGAGLVAGVAGLAVSHAVGLLVTVHESPVVAVGEWARDVVPPGLDLVADGVAEPIAALVGALGRMLLVGIPLAVVLAALAWAGVLAARSLAAAYAVHAGLAVLAGLVVLDRAGSTAFDLLPVALGLVVWVLVLAHLRWLLARQPREGRGGVTRRGFLVESGLVLAVSAVLVGGGQLLSRGTRRVRQVRTLLRIPGVTEPTLPRGVRVGPAEVAPWMTPTEDFFRVDTAITVPTIEPTQWELRIHGLVDRPLTFTYRDLLDRERDEAWVTLACVSNEVGGSLVGNAWWSGVRVADLLYAVGVQEGADAVLQTAYDGWTCATPLAALTDDRDALLALAMNGDPLPLEHGFPVRMVVPGLYGYVSATKWLVDLEVTRFADVEAYWTTRGWAEQAPCRLASRIDAPRAGAVVPAGTLRVGGVAWHPHVGIRGVQVALDGGPWTDAELGRVPQVDTWVQWTASVDVALGEHLLRVRAVSSSGETQTGVERDVLPDGATGWHRVEFTCE